MPINSTAQDRALSVFRQHNGMLKTGEAIRAGIHPRTLYALRDAGLVHELSRGIYRLTEMPPLGNPDLVAVMTRVPEAVICLISALAFHDITTQIPHAVYIAVPRNSRLPQIDHPPVRVFWFSARVFSAGIEHGDVDGSRLRIYSPEKTLADCFKYRNKIGLDVAVEALRLYRERKPVRADELLRFARVCRAENVMRPYLEALL